MENEILNQILQKQINFEKEQQEMKQDIQLLKGGQAKLEEGQRVMTQDILDLKESQIRFEKRMSKLEKGQAKLEEGLTALEERLITFENDMSRKLDRTAGFILDEIERRINFESWQKRQENKNAF